MDLIRFGKRICTLPRRPEPKLLGQHEIMPSAGSLRNTGPGPFIALIDISNIRRLGFPEYALVQDMIACVNKLVELEERST
jgi:hypothetical protein